MRHWWRQTGGRAAGRRRGRMPIWCLHLSVNVMSSIWQQDDQNRQRAGEKPHTGRINLSLCPARHSFILTDYVHLHNFARLFGLFVCFSSSSAIGFLLLKRCRSKSSAWTQRLSHFLLLHLKNIQNSLICRPWCIDSSVESEVTQIGWRYSTIKPWKQS